MLGVGIKIVHVKLCVYTEHDINMVWHSFDGAVWLHVCYFFVAFSFTFSLTFYRVYELVSFLSEYLPCVFMISLHISFCLILTCVFLLFNSLSFDLNFYSMNCFFLFLFSPSVFTWTNVCVDSVTIRVNGNSITSLFFSFMFSCDACKMSFSICCNRSIVWIDSSAP